MQALGGGYEGRKWRCSSRVACRSRGRFPLFLGQQRRRSTSGVVGVAERKCGGEMSEQGGAVVLGRIINRGEMV
jgi:hypothetical protein